MTDKKDKSDAVTDKKETQIDDTGKIVEQLVLEVEPTLIIPDGKHTGIITEIAFREEPFGYIDISIQEKKSKAELKTGYPAKITQRTSLGKLLSKFGVAVEVGVKIDLKREMLSREVTFVTENEENEKGVFARVIKGTVKPLN